MTEQRSNTVDRNDASRCSKKPPAVVMWPRPAAITELAAKSFTNGVPVTRPMDYLVCAIAPKATSMPASDATEDRGESSLSASALSHGAVAHSHVSTALS